MLVSILLVIIGLSILILVHELGHFLAAKFFCLKVEEFGIGFPPRIFSKIIGETKYSINFLPLGGFVRLQGEFEQAGARSFMAQKPWKRGIVLVAGVTMNFLLGWMLLSLVFFIGAPTAILVNQVLPNSSAQTAGILEGDQIFGASINLNINSANPELGEWIEFSSAKELTSFIKNHQNQEILLKIKRTGIAEPILIKATPKESLGIIISNIGFPKQPFFQSFVSGFTYSLSIIWSILIALRHIFNTPGNFVGPVGIFNVAVETGKLGLIYILQLLALISLNLTVLNLLPIPALDGGRLFFLLIEKIRGVAMSTKKELFWNGIGFAFLISLIVLVTVNDVLKLIL